MPQDRRTFLATLGAAALGAAAHRAFAELPSSSAKLSRIGIQLYTLRSKAEKDLAGTLAEVARIGYKEVELAGFYGHTASEFRQLLDQNGLAAPSAHIAIEEVENESAKTFADARTLGLQWITVPSLPGHQTTVDDWKRMAERFTKSARRSNPPGSGLRTTITTPRFEGSAM